MKLETSLNSNESRLSNQCYQPAPSSSGRSQGEETKIIMFFNIQDPDGDTLPSALIPFCAYKSNLETLGTSIPGLSFPVCNAFRPTILHGQLCYSLDIENMSLKEETEITKQGKADGILIIVDPNNERSETGGAKVLKRLGSGSTNKLLNLSPKVQHGGSALVNIHTLIRWIMSHHCYKWKINCLRYKVYSEGEFLLRSPKRMTGTEGFLEQNSGERSECQRERQETCEIRKFAEKGFENCACRPWGLLSALPSEV